jgi:arylsulfatase A-like enzyme
VGRVLDYLDATGLTEDTIVVYTSDQGFFLGDHGWFDKRFVYEESLSMPFLVQYLREISPGTVCRDMVLNADFAPTFLDLAGLPVPKDVQGTSFRPLLGGETPPGWQASMDYRHRVHRDGAHNVRAHYGVRTRRHKLIYFSNDPLDQPEAWGPVDRPEWELDDLEADPFEIHDIASDPAAGYVLAELERELSRLQALVGDLAHGG